MSRSYRLCYLLGILWFHVLCSSLIHFELIFCVWCKVVVKFHSFAYGCSIFSIPYVKETVLFPLFTLGCFVIRSVCVFVCVCVYIYMPYVCGFISELSFLLTYVSVFMPNSILF